SGLAGIDGLRLPDFEGGEYFDSYQNYVIRTSRRDALRRHLQQQGVETLVHWSKPMWKHRGLNLENPGLRETTRLCDEVLSLPMSAETTAEQVEIVTSCMQDFFACRAAAIPDGALLANRTGLNPA